MRHIAHSSRCVNVVRLLTATTTPPQHQSVDLEQCMLTNLVNAVWYQHFTRAHFDLVSQFGMLKAFRTQPTSAPSCKKKSWVARSLEEQFTEKHKSMFCRGCGTQEHVPGHHHPTTHRWNSVCSPILWMQCDINISLVPTSIWSASLECWRHSAHNQLAPPVAKRKAEWRVLLRNSSQRNIYIYTCRVHIHLKNYTCYIDICCIPTSQYGLLSV